MKVWKDKSGKWIDHKEFWQRFSKGVEGISPIQQAQTSLVGQFIILGGVIFGLIVNLMAQVWWLFVVLLGSLLVVSTATLGAWQKYKTLKKMEETFESLDDIDDNDFGAFEEEMKGGEENKNGF